MKKRPVRQSPNPADLASPSKPRPTPRPAIPEDAVLVWDVQAALSGSVPSELSERRSFAIIADGGFAILNSRFQDLLAAIVEGAKRLKVYAAVVPLYHPELAKMKPDRRVEVALQAGVPEAPARALAEEEEADQVFCTLFAMWEPEQTSHLQVLISADRRWPEGRALWFCRNVLAPDHLRRRTWAVVGGGWEKAAKQAGFFFRPE